MTNLEKYLYQLRCIEEHREAAAEREIRKIYKELLKELNGFLGNIYATYSEDDMLDYSMLARAGMDARFLEEVEQRINRITPEAAKEIEETVTQTYEACYDGMRNAVVKAAGNRSYWQQAFSTVKAVTPDVIKQAVNNPVSGLTLKDTLEKHRKDIIYDIKRNIGVGLSNGDRFSTMAKRISESLDGDYRKSIRVVRTEAHRVRESGFNDAATDINTALKNGKSSYVMAKTWNTMQDSRVRPNGQKKKKYNHEKMDGVTIPQDEEFELPSGAKCMHPSKTGVAGEDINCRCYLSYDLVLASEIANEKNKQATKEQQQNEIVSQDKVIKRAKEIGQELLENPALLEYDNGYCISNYVNKKIGYDSLPKVVPSDYFNELAKDKTILYRGIAPTKQKTAEEMVEAYKTGKFFCGRGVYGNGTYTDTNIETVRKYSGYSGEIMQLMLEKDAKVADFLDIYKEYEKTGIQKIIGEKPEAYQDVIADVGTYAALKGYDAIALNGFRQLNYVVILNRGKTIIKG